MRGCVVADISTRVCRRQMGPDANRPDRVKPHGDEHAPAPFVSIGEGVLADDQRCDKASRPNRIAKLITAGGSFQIGVEKKFEMASLLPQACDFSSRLCGNAKRLRCLLVLDDMHAGAVLFFHLFCRNYSAAKVCELHELALDRL